MLLQSRLIGRLARNALPVLVPLVAQIKRRTDRSSIPRHFAHADDADDAALHALLPTCFSMDPERARAK